MALNPNATRQESPSNSPATPNATARHTATSGGHWWNTTASDSPISSPVQNGALTVPISQWQRVGLVGRALLALTKPSITLASTFAAATGYLWAASQTHLAIPLLTPTFWLTLLATALSVGGACTVNMWLERDIDRRMKRTQHRPFPSGQITPTVGLGFGLVIGFAGMLLLVLVQLPFTAALTAFAFVSYTLLYTPLKPETPFAFVPGIIPGALPVLIGWSAATDAITPAAWALFALLALWQIPHSLSISIYLRDDYAHAGIRTFCQIYGLPTTRRWMLVFSILVVLASLALVPFAPKGWLLGAVAILTGMGFFFLCIQGYRTQQPNAWAKQMFRASLLHLTLLFLAIHLETWLL